MAATKIYNIFIIFLIIQFTYGKAIDNDSTTPQTSEEKKELTTTDKFLVFTFANSLVLGLTYADKSFNIAQQILSDPTLVQRSEPEIIEFRQNLTEFIKEYVASAEPQKSWDVMEMFTNTIGSYLELTEDQLTEESKLLVDVINKYKCKELITEFAQDFGKYLENLKQNFEDKKLQLDSAALELYEMFTSSEFKENINFFELGKDD